MPVMTDIHGRTLTAPPKTLFDNKLLQDSQSLFWDDQELSGGGTASAHDSDYSAQRLSVSDSTAGRRVRQTFQRMNYQPSKTMRVSLTGRMPSAAGITAYVGLLDDEDGVAWGSKDGVWGVLLRSSVSGSPVDTWIPQTSWRNPLPAWFDLSVAELWVLEYTWQGTGPVRWGVLARDTIHWVHEVFTAGESAAPYMSNPNLPVRFEVANDGTGVASELLQICTVVESLGGHDADGLVRSELSPVLPSAGNFSAGTTYALLGIRLQAARLHTIVNLLKSMVLVTSNDTAQLSLRLNPTVTGTFSYSDVSGSAVQLAYGTAAPTASGGTIIDADLIAQKSSIASVPANSLRLGAAIDGTPTEIVLCATPISNAVTLYAGVGWREQA